MLLMSLLFPAIAGAKNITLRFSDQNSKTGWGPVHALAPWIEMVEEAVRKNTEHERKIIIFLIRPWQRARITGMPSEQA
jgi:hypothetical protein